MHHDEARDQEKQIYAGDAIKALCGQKRIGQEAIFDLGGVREEHC